MTALPRPDLPPGPARTLNDALHDLHHRAGWPSLRTLARETGVSHTTVSKIFSSSAPPPWGTVELVVEAMAGDCDLFRELWLAATSPTNGDASPVAPGIGKTTLVTRAAKSTSARTAVGNCLPLSGEICLLPIADCIRSVREQDVQAFSQVLTDCPSYVSRPLSALVPEVGTVTSGATRAEDRGLLFGALAAVLRACADRGRLALLRRGQPRRVGTPG